MEKTYRAWLERNGYRFTAQRKAVLEEVLLHKGRHFTCDEVYLNLREKGVGQATVYRNLPLLEAAGIVRQTILAGISCYEVAKPEEKHAHHHLICLRCERVEEAGDLLSALEEEIKARYGFEVLNHEATFTGLCRQCRESG